MAQLHEVLQIAFGWEDSHLNRFEIRGREYGVYRDGRPAIHTDARKFRLCDLKLRRLERFMYEYDFAHGWIHDLRIEATLPVDPRKTYPVCVAGKRAAPTEDCGGPCAFMANHRHYVGFGHGQSREELDDFMDEFDDDDSDFIGDHRPDKFDRRQINRALGKLA